MRESGKFKGSFSLSWRHGQGFMRMHIVVYAWLRVLFLQTLEENGEYKKHMINEQSHVLEPLLFTSVSGIIQIRVDSKLLKEKCVKSIHYEILSDTSTCDGELNWTAVHCLLCRVADLQWAWPIHVHRSKIKYTKCLTIFRFHKTFAYYGLKLASCLTS